MKQEHGRRQAMASDRDKFVDIMSATAMVDLPLSSFRPVSSLCTPVHMIKSPRFPVIDYHNHLDSVDPLAALRVMDAAGVERIVNITMRVGDVAFEIADNFRRASRDRFLTIGWMDWTGLERPDFVSMTIERLKRMLDQGFCGIKFWKDFGLTLKGEDGKLVRIDDERFAPIFEFCGEHAFPVMFHTADPTAFFQEIDATNERYEELAAHPDWGFSTSPVSKQELLDQRNAVIRRHPKTTFVGAHCAESGEDLTYLTELLDELPNLQIDFSARTPELGRQPYAARKLFLNYADRIIFGTDLLPEVEMYRLYYRFLETADEYFDYPSHASRQGRWNIYGIFLPEDVLLKVYRENALKLLTPFL
jgi:predicted TIM-barrel fold metal-dependent hydrolase